MKNNIIKLVLGGILVLVFGLFISYKLNNNSISSIQGYLYAGAFHSTDSNASSSNASSSNASSSNASSSNASSSNASSGNASNANASLTDNIIYLQSFKLNSASAKQGDKVYITLTTSGACNSAASIVFYTSNGISFTAQVNDITRNPYIVIPNSAVPGTYDVNSVLLVGRNSNNTTFTKIYGKTGVYTYDFNHILKVTSKDGDSSKKKIKLNSFSLNSSSVKVGDKVYFDIDASEKISSLKLTFVSKAGEEFVTYAKDLSSKPYFEVPSTVVADTYNLTGAILYSNLNSTVYTSNGKDGEKYNFNTSLEVSDSSRTKYLYNNEDINYDVLATLYNAPIGSEIVVNADSNAWITEELFNTIKGKDKTLIINYMNNQIVFNGRDITQSKTVDLTMTINDVSSHDRINKLVSKGIIVNFPDNGNLPGKALVRVNATEEIDKVLKDNAYVYIYNKSTNNFCVVDVDIKKTSDGYYEFNITHNSDYLITNEKLDSKLVVATNEDNIVNFQKGNGVYLLLIGLGIVVIIAVIIVISVLKKKNGNTSNEEKEEEQ